MTFTPGSTIVERGIIGRRFMDGGVCGVKPVTVVADEPGLIALWAPLGIPTMAARPLDGAGPRPWLAHEVRLVPAFWRWRHALALALPGQRYSTWVTWSESWEFLGWYINLQSLLCRTPIGFDVRDHQLDVLIAPDRSWQWKDEDDLERAVELGQIPAAMAVDIRRSGEAAIAAVQNNEPPFCDPWPEWRPPPDWSVPTTLPDWRI